MNNVKRTISEILEWQVVIENAVVVVSELIKSLNSQVTTEDVENQITASSEARKKLVEAIDAAKERQTK